MPLEFKLPDIGEGLTEGEVTKWLVREGETVKADQPMVEVMTDKATVEITSPRAGTIQKILVPDGTTVPVGTVIVVIGDGGGAAAAAPAAAPAKAPAAAKPAAAAPKAAPAPAAASRGHGPAPVPAPARAPAPSRSAPPASARPAPAGAGPRADLQTAYAGGAASRAQGSTVAAPAKARPAPAPVAVEEPPAADDRRPVLAAPATRRLAREMGIDLRQVRGSGPNGRVTRADLDAFSEGGAAPAAVEETEEAAEPAEAAAPRRAPAPAPARTEGDEHVAFSGVRGKIAEQMLRSKQRSPHFTFADECDVTDLVALRAQAKSIAEERGTKLTYLPFVIKALVAAFRRYPTLNAVVDDEKNEYVVRRQYNIGIATDTPQGLMVPVVHDADRRTILEIAAEIERLTEAARTKKISLNELRGGTFTITSAGSIGGILATPILNYPEVGILGVYKIADRAVVRDGQVVVRKMMNLSITLDHRVVDGATAAYFLNEVIRYLETPNLLLLEGI